jgi:hypothetical protein
VFLVIKSTYFKTPVDNSFWAFMRIICVCAIGIIENKLLNLYFNKI